MPKKDWISGAIKRPGAFSAKARRAGMTTIAYARKHQKAPGLLGQQARLAITFSNLRKRGAKAETKVEKAFRVRRKA
jgi:hypothetical protein